MVVVIKMVLFFMVMLVKILMQLFDDADGYVRHGQGKARQEEIEKVSNGGHRLLRFWRLIE